MVDFWFTLGAMVIDPKLLDRVGANTYFMKISETIQDTVNGQLMNPVTHHSAGYLDTGAPPNNLTMVLRGIIRDYLETKFLRGHFGPHPPISLYTAAKFCQLWAYYQNGTLTAVSLAHKAFVKAKGKKLKKLSPHFPTLLGAAFVDDALVGYLTTPGSQDIANEFGVKPDPRRKEWQVITAWLNDSNFNGTTGAQNILLTAPSWDVVCRERMIFYANFKRAAN